ncbi:MAG: MotA/TolQ/ExbB proton channel family protein [Planctomycetota bacterium]
MHQKEDDTVKSEASNASHNPSIDPNQSLGPNIGDDDGSQSLKLGPPQGEWRGGVNTFVSAALGMVLSGGFYAVLQVINYAPANRYFLGHPVAISATVLFWFGIAVLISKWFAIAAQGNQLAAIRDQDLTPQSSEDSPASRWLQQNDAGHVARNWLGELDRLPSETRDSHLVNRLTELLTRQSQRGTAKHLADDLRELSARDADAAHDSLGLVRIIVWAIPMLGFLGTVIGITQTLGGLDFSNGAAAVDNLKSGLYVAFDTTALGLVLSVIAIFIQFPIERSEQKLLAEIDARVGHLVSACLPSDETSDNQTALIADLCRGVQAAVAESLENQAKLWRDTIDEAQNHWQAVHQNNNDRIAEAFEQVLVPALQQHASSIETSSRSATEQLEKQCDRGVRLLGDAHDLMERSHRESAETLNQQLESVLQRSLQDHACSLDESSQLAADRMERQWERLQTGMAHHADTISSQQLSLLNQYDALVHIHRQAGSLTAMQSSLDQNLLRLAEINASIDQSVSAAAGDGMADAMRILARAVDVLSKRLSEYESSDTPRSTRHAA